jgi:hypothetical protein
MAKKTTKKTGFLTAATSALTAFNEEEVQGAYDNTRDTPGGGGWIPDKGSYLMRLTQPDGDDPERYIRVWEPQEGAKYPSGDPITPIAFCNLPVRIESAPAGSDDEGLDRLLPFQYQIKKTKEGLTYWKDGDKIKHLRKLIEAPDGEDLEFGSSPVEDHAIVLENHCTDAVLLEVKVTHRKYTKADGTEVTDPQFRLVRVVDE